MKKLYEQPELEVQLLQFEDVLKESSGLDEDELPPIPV